MLEYPDIKNLIPHREPMIMVDGILFEDDNSIHVEKTFGDQDYGTCKGVVLESALIEMAAQAVAVKQGLDAWREQSKPDIGMLVSITKFQFNSIVKSNRPVEVHVKKESRVGPFYILKIQVFQNRKPAAQGGIQLYIEDPEHTSATQA